ncbi:hypothetical protein ACSFA0_24445 [Variovorax sp. LT1P1]
MNDINAACAAASVAPKQTVVSSPEVSIESRVRTLTDLKDKGLLSPVEYDSRRSEILASI